MSIQNPNTTELSRILRDTRTVAVVGASDNQGRPSNEVFDYLARASHFELYPVNPNAAEVCGVTAYRASRICRSFPTWWTSSAADDLPTVLAEVLALSPRPKYRGCNRVCGTSRSPRRPSPPA